jgi:hypothetical protein
MSPGSFPKNGIFGANIKLIPIITNTKPKKINILAN